MNKKTKWGIVFLILILMFMGIYLYNYFPQLIPGLATDDLEINRDINILVMGIDDVQDKEQSNVENDAIIMAQYKNKSKTLNLNSISPELEIEGKKLKKYSTANLRKEIEKLLNIDEDYYFVISYGGFVKFIDEIGGVPVKLDQKLKINDLNLNLKKGENLLSGKEALNYMRWYNYDQDKIERLKKQEKIIMAVKDKVINKNYLKDIPKLYSTIVNSYQMVEGNLDQKLISDLVQIIQKNEKLKINYEIVPNK